MSESKKTNGKPVYVNPYAEFGAEVPNWLLKRREVTPGAKVVYGQIMQIFHEPTSNGPRATGSIELAEDVGMDQAHVTTYLRELVERKLIGFEPKDSGYAFFPLENEWHKEMLYYVEGKQEYKQGSVVLEEGGDVFEGNQP
jgi:hypothetical protein